MSRLTVLVISAVLGALLSAPASAQWKWRDKSGVVQYSDLPPPSGTPDKDVLQKPGAGQRKAPVSAAPASGASAPATAAALPNGVDLELEAKRRKAEQDVLAKNKADEDKSAATRAENCTRAKAYARTLDEGTRIVRTDTKGEREFLDDKARAEEVKRTKAVIASDCK
jgi:hypothetical protein